MKATKANITKVLQKRGMIKSELLKGRICWRDSEGFYYAQFAYPTQNIFLSYQESTFHHAPDFEQKRDQMLQRMMQILSESGFSTTRDGDWLEIQTAVA